MKFRINWVVRGPIGTIVAPNVCNPVPAQDLANLLRLLSENVPGNKSLGIETIGVQIDPVEESADASANEETTDAD